MRLADAHADALMWNRDLTVRSEEGHVDFPRLIETGFALQCFPVVTRGFPFIGGFPVFGAVRGWPLAALKSEWTRACFQLDRMDALCAREPRVRKVQHLGDLDAALATHQLAAVLGVEGAHAIEGRVERVSELRSRGVQFMGLTHLSNNPLGGSSFPLMGNRPLSSLGQAVLDAMAEVRMAVDVAHASERTLEDVLAHPTAQPFCSHTGVRAEGGGWRNLSDSALRRIADRGGVVGIIFGTVYLGGDRVSDLVRHIEHALRTIGEDAVALGSDFDGMVPLPKGMRDTRDVGQIAHALQARGHPARVVEKVMGENLIRFFGRLLSSRREAR